MIADLVHVYKPWQIRITVCNLYAERVFYIFKGNYSWIGKELLYVEMRSESSSLASLTVLLGPSVQQGIWTLFLVISLLHNCLLSLIGFFYNTYIVEA